MNREIKFRVWDNRLNNFNYFDLLSVQGNLPHDCLKNIQQFIGLYDKNNKEIYEGDIVSHGSHTQYYESVVAYKAPSFIGKNYFYRCNNSMKFDGGAWDIVWEKKGWEAFENGWYRSIMSLDSWNFIEVIGNIYDNPELLG